MTSRLLLALLYSAVIAHGLVPAVLAETVVGEGVVRSDERVVIRSKVPGPIRRIPVREGDVLKRGQLLLEMDNDTARAQVEAAIAEVRRAEAAVLEVQRALESATREYERNLKVPDLITTKELDLSRDAMLREQASLRTRQEEFLKARKQLEVARANFDDTVIRAPFNGVVARIYVREGDMPKATETDLLDFLSLDRLYVEVALPLPYLGSVREGMAAALDIEDESAAIRTSATGKIRYIFPEVDPTTRMFRAKIDLPRAGTRIRPGMFAKVRIEVQSQPR